MDCVLLKDRNLALAPTQGPEINSRACLCVLPRPRHHTQCWLTNQRLRVILLISCLQTPKAGSGPTNFRAEPSLASSSAISFPRTPACPGTQYSSTACRAEISFNACWTHGDVLTALRAFKAAYQSRYVLLWSALKLNVMNTPQDSIYLSLKNGAFFPQIAHRLSPGPLLHPGPICKPDEPFDYRRSPSSFGTIFPSQHSNLIFGLKIECWPHNIYPHI